MGNLLSLQVFYEDKRRERQRFLQTLVTITGQRDLAFLGTAAYNCESRRLSIPVRVYDSVCQEVGYSVVFVELDRTPWPRRVLIRPRRGDTGRRLSPRGARTTKTLSLRKFIISPTPNKRLDCFWDVREQAVLLDYGISSGRMRIRQYRHGINWRDLYSQGSAELAMMPDGQERAKLRDKLCCIARTISGHIEELDQY